MFASYVSLLRSKSRLVRQISLPLIHPPRKHQWSGCLTTVAFKGWFRPSRTSFSARIIYIYIYIHIFFGSPFSGWLPCIVRRATMLAFFFFFWTIFMCVANHASLPLSRGDGFVFLCSQIVHLQSLPMVGCGTSCILTLSISVVIVISHCLICVNL